ncbi:hypothetical protein PCI56_21890 [Plesiomonas shigelloides subsp. oncorhynchi]|nr:hypothetical protein [Plesiomonas shigelloides]
MDSLYAGLLVTSGGTADFAAMGGIFSERSGVVDIGLEGKMLFAAFMAAAVSAVSGSVWLGLFSAIGASVLLSLVHGYACINQRGDQVISGLAVNFFASGMTITLGHAWFGRGGQTPTLESGQRFWCRLYQVANG